MLTGKQVLEDPVGVFYQFLVYAIFLYQMGAEKYARRGVRGDHHHPTTYLGAATPLHPSTADWSTVYLRQQQQQEEQGDDGFLAGTFN